MPPPSIAPASSIASAPAAPAPTRVDTITPDAARAALGRGVQLAEQFYARHDRAGRRGVQPVRATLVRGPHSSYNQITGRVAVGASHPDHQKMPAAPLFIAGTTAHEVGHRYIARQVGFPGPFVGFSTGIVVEGLAQVLGGAALIQEGTPAEARQGWYELDPRGRTTRMGDRDVPLSTHTRHIAERRIPWWDDFGGMHVHAGIIQEAHRRMADARGIDEMARVTLRAIDDGAGRIMSIEHWARATRDAAAAIGGAGSPAVDGVLRAWEGVGVLLA